MSETNGHIKHFVLDTNVLLHNPNALFMFADNEVVIPFDVIEELDKFKTNSDDLGRNARTVIRYLDSLRLRGRLSDGVPVPQSGGRVRVILEEDQKLCPGLTANTPDNRIICCAFGLLQEGKRVVFITKDINARIKSDAMGLVAEDFEAQKVDFERLYTGWRELAVPATTINRLFSEKQIRMDLPDTFVNEFVLMKDEVDPSHTAIARIRADGMLAPVRARRGPVFGVMPRNLQQTMALDLLLDDSVKLVSLIGAAGTGKTLLALAAGLAKTLNEEVYQKMLCARPIMPLGRDIGYLPGDKDQKLTAWMQPIFDNLEFLFSTGSRKGPRAYAELLESGQIQVEPLTYIRGRSLPQQFIVVDEAQNLTPHEVKTIITRSGDGTKIVFTGDPGQIDNPYVDSASNGLTVAAERFRGERLAAHIVLAKGERSDLAELAANML